MHTLTGTYIYFFLLRLTYIGTHVVVLCYHARVQLIMGSTTRLDPNFAIFQPCLCLRKRQECDPCTFVRVPFVWPTLAIATIPFSWFLFCHVEHHQLTTCSVWHESLPDHARPCQNTWARHYAAERDWLKSKSVCSDWQEWSRLLVSIEGSALFGYRARSGPVCCGLYVSCIVYTKVADR